jgi:carboxyl-terminal processing protease
VDAYRQEKYNRYESGELLTLDSLELPDSLKYKTRLQGRTVYGGGGILPDIFVPLDTTDNSEYFSRILRKGLDSRFALRYVDSLRTDLEVLYPSEDAFIDRFSLSEDEIQDFIDYAENDGVEFSEEDWAKSSNAIRLRLHAMIGRNLYESSTFYRVISGLNESLQRAIEVLENGTFDESNLAHKTF